MGRDSKRKSREKPRERDSEPVLATDPEPASTSTAPFWNRRRLTLAVLLLLVIHLTLAVRSLVSENPTIDEVIHLPAGVTYWQKGTFSLYHHNPPLVKLVAALPLVASGGFEVPYGDRSWREPQNKAAFAHEFQRLNARQYFELFARGRLMMPLFSVLGGLVVFFWSERLYGVGGGLLSLTLWLFCPNILAHCRLVTTDVGAASMGVLATFIFWHYLQRPSWPRAVLAGVCLGLAQLTKFSMIVLYGLWPILGILHLIAGWDWTGLGRRLGLRSSQALLMFVLSVIVIDIGYAFEGVGTPLKRFEFLSRSLTRPVAPGDLRPISEDQLINAIYSRRVNRFRGTWLESLPVPFPKHYVLGFDDQKFEAEGVPESLFNPTIESDEVKGYPVYLNGVLSQSSWWYYYFLTLVYKVPEGTWLLFIASVVVLFAASRARARWADEATVFSLPVLILFVMSLFTNINLGLRYVLPVLPFVYISMGKLVPWAAGLSSRVGRRLAGALVGGAMVATVASTLLVAPHYLAYFNWVSGGPSNGSEHLIDSNIDWGQDLVGLRRWLGANAPGEPVGLAYFGQINPNIFLFRHEGGFPWFLPPPRRGSIAPMDIPPRYRKEQLQGIQFQPGLYAVSASLVRGLPWRVYENELPRWAPRAVWENGFSYFQELKPIGQIGYSIFLYRVTPEQAEELSRHWLPDAPVRTGGGPG